MKTVGTRIQPPLTWLGSGDALKAGAALSESLAGLGSGRHIRKGVYRYSSHEEANAHDDACLATSMATRVMERAAPLVTHSDGRV